MSNSQTLQLISLIISLAITLPRDALLTIYKSFVRPHLDYGDIIYDQPQNESFCNKLESIQYNAALAITGAIQGTSKTKLYKELGLEFLKSRRWFRQLCTFYKIRTYNIPLYTQQTYYPKELIHTILTTQKTSLHFKAEQKLLGFPSSHGLLLNGIDLI